MVKVITYGTYDLLHYGHIKLLERAKALGDYLIVGVTSDDYDKSRGKINNRQTLMERVNAVIATGLADEVIVEEYDGQKIDDIIRYGIDIFTLGSDWEGKFDYLNAYCKVIYLPRTEGISSSEIRASQGHINMGIIDSSLSADKFIKEAEYVNGISVKYCNNDYSMLDAVYISSEPEKRYEYIKSALQAGKHVLCEAPFALAEDECRELIQFAKEKKLVLMPSIKTAYLTAFNRLVLMAKSGKIGEIISIDATCTSLRDNQYSFFSWASIAMMPIMKLLGTEYRFKRIISRYSCENCKIDEFTKVEFVFDKAVASIKLASAAKSEGELIITGTKGYIYVPAPWWKTDYFELRFENTTENKRFFYQLDGEGIRYEIAAFSNRVCKGYTSCAVTDAEVISISKLTEAFLRGEDTIRI